MGAKYLHTASAVLALGTVADGEYLKRSGSDIVSDGGGWRKLAAVTASASAAVAFTGLSATYAAYKVILTNVAPATDNVSLYLRTSTNNGSSYDAGASDYAWMQNLTHTGGANSPAGDTADGQIVLLGGLGNGSNETAAGEVTIYNPSAAAYCRVRYGFEYNDNVPRDGIVVGGGVRLAAADVDAIQFLMSSGNIASGTFALFGMVA